MSCLSAANGCTVRAAMIAGSLFLETATALRASIAQRLTKYNSFVSAVTLTQPFRMASFAIDASLNYYKSSESHPCKIV